MKVLVDTCIWSLSLRRNKQPASNIEVVEFQELIEEVRVQLIGPIRQEILSGVKRKQQFSKLKKILSAFPVKHYKKHIPIALHAPRVTKK
jgi:hypothetical protein